MKWTLPGAVAPTGAPALTSVPNRPGRPTRVAIGALGLVFLFGLGYRISARRRRTTAV
jgi:hypothetical protein